MKGFFGSHRNKGGIGDKPKVPKPAIRPPAQKPIKKCSKCKTGHAREHFDMGLSCGDDLCDSCFEDMVNECRSRSW